MGCFVCAGEREGSQEGVGGPGSKTLMHGEACVEEALGKGRTGFPLGCVRFEVGLLRDAEMAAC